MKLREAIPYNAWWPGWGWPLRDNFSWGADHDCLHGHTEYWFNFGPMQIRWRLDYHAVHDWEDYSIQVAGQDWPVYRCIRCDRLARFRS